MDNADTHINHLESGLPRWIIEAAFAVMVISAICTTTDILNWMRSELPLVNALLQTLGMVIIYWAYLRGMKKLSKPLTTLWWMAIALNLLGFCCSAIPTVDSIFGLPVALALQPVYLPLGTGLLLLYRGRLMHTGIWMIVRILVVSYAPIFYDLLQPYFPLLLLDILTVGTELIYAWVLRRALV